MDLASPALDRSGNGVVEVSWCAQRKKGPALELLHRRRAPARLGHGDRKRGNRALGCSYLRGGGGEEGEEEGETLGRGWGLIEGVRTPWLATEAMCPCSQVYREGEVARGGRKR